MKVEIYAFWKESDKLSGIMGGPVEEIVNGIFKVNGKTYRRHPGMVLTPADIGKQIVKKLREMDQSHENDLEAIACKYSGKLADLFKRNLLNLPIPMVGLVTGDNVTTLPVKESEGGFPNSEGAPRTFQPSRV